MGQATRAPLQVAQSLLLLGVCMCLASCDGRFELPPPGYRPTYLVQITPARLYPEATEVRLAIQNDFAWVGGKLVEHKHATTVLSPQQREAFEQTLHRTRLIGFPPPDEAGARPACFVPHHFFRYYDRHGRHVGEVAVCFCCSGFEATPNPASAGGELGVDILAVKELVRRMGVPTDIACH